MKSFPVQSLVHKSAAEESEQAFEKAGKMRESFIFEDFLQIMKFFLLFQLFIN